MGNKDSKSSVQKSNSKSHGTNEVKIAKEDNITNNIPSDLVHPFQSIVYDVKPPKENIRQKAFDVERELLSTLGLTLDEEVFYEDVFFNFFGKNYLHTLRTGYDPEKENIIFIHGYQGSSIGFFKLLPYLKKIFNVYCPDTIGMGLSSRPCVNFKTTEEWVDYFVESFEQWRVALKIDQFYLVGHSLGGYFAGAYALKYQNNIKKLFLLSPAGITDFSKGGKVFEYADTGRKVGFYLLGTLWKAQPTVQGTCNNFLIKPIMNLSLRTRYDIPKREKLLTAKITECAMDYPPDLDKVIYYIFSVPIPKAALPLEEKLFNDLSICCDIIYGEKDWMDQSGCRRLCEKDPIRFKILTVSKYGHNFPIENPEELSTIIIENIVKEHNNIHRGEEEENK